MKTGNPVIVAGTHVYPFAKDYSVNFIMTAFHRGKAPENQLLTAVFNSFRLLDSPPK
jgi:tRNA(Ile)-lysidine synthase TilS/MesJ